MNKLLHPAGWILLLVPPVVFAALVYIFYTGKTDSMPAYLIYFMSAYCLTIWVIPVPGLIRKAKARLGENKAVQRLVGSEFGRKYRSDLAFRGSISIYQGMTVNFCYMLFRVVVGIRFASVWFISMAVYYLVLGGLRLFLIINYRHRNREKELICYRRTAWLLFLLNIPMGGMILLMVLTDSGFSYPGYVIYLSAMYTFYTMIISVINLVKFRRLGSPILSAAKVLNFVSAMMSILGLQTAMIAQFSTEGEDFRRTMNAACGTAVWGTVVATAVYMLWHSKKIGREVHPLEQIGK